MKNVNFIPKKVILYFHEQLIQIYGGSTGIRDEKLLDSAIKQPKSTFEGNYLHDSIFKMASAYGFHLCKNHPFIDGNKRVALVAMDTFLQNNGYEITASEKETYKIMIKLSSENLSKDELTKWIVQNTISI
ncbi:death-on-curing family protein [Halobacteroides halobius DSM 5150]|uniref:Death-on-curing family protein n=1 Tax=Halobacteroides halobius (strain ATCC 35273 / DSM 5150 / MD-1) TaxID=748449 RepID=L0K8T6_HALHC|nr:type II toxin-antitoxin system death-on-curing family toxin [Halobacteroides halobius]AGB41421.1 death-on-curing family protein [Halobacteroides halobius DSM 5150]